MEILGYVGFWGLLVGVTCFVIVVFLICRALVLWYFRINEAIDHLVAIRTHFCGAPPPKESWWEYPEEREEKT
ncbi:MAG: hypothetical protein JRD47_06915 [Deltaproteobacteria bacterium]|nr:hypothetical protein [Deltaproteobacteria bacterium]